MNFLARYGSFMLFLLLESYALYLATHFNKRQGEIYESSRALLVGSMYENVSVVGKYLDIEKLADSLARENASLKTQLESAKYNNVAEKGTVKFPLDTSTVRPDTIHTKDVIQQFSYVAAEVVDNSIARQDNFMIINRGSLHGIKPDMGVISGEGIVGIVREVTPRYSKVLSTLNKQVIISAMVKRNRFFGALSWKGANPRILTMSDVPKHAELVKGDTVQTSGFSEKFPGGVNIGVISNLKVDNGSNFYTIEVRLFNDPSLSRYVYVVGNLFTTEIKQLQIEKVKPKFNVRPIIQAN